MHIAGQQITVNIHNSVVVVLWWLQPALVILYSHAAMHIAVQGAIMLSVHSRCCRCIAGPVQLRAKPNN